MAQSQYDLKNALVSYQNSLNGKYRADLVNLNFNF